MAVVIGVRCLKFIETELKLPIEKKYVWSDSQCVLKWISSEKDLSVFVRNRVKQINKYSEIHFGYISTNENPADVATRGTNIKKLCEDKLWWHGPIWLKNKKKGTVCSRTTLTSDELIGAEKKSITYIQRKHFPDVYSDLATGKANNLQRQLGIFIRDDEILCCRGRLENADLCEGARKPILLPRKDILTNLLIERFHNQILHSGVSQTLGKLRQIYWIPQGRATVRQVIRHCKICRRFEGGAYKMPAMAPDNASQFKLSSNVIQSVWSQVIHDEDVQNFASNSGTRWSFIIELSPWMGGFYERLVGLVKRSLRKTLKKKLLTDVQLQTILKEVEAIINSRPLVYVGDDINSTITLTSSHFLSLNPKVGIPEIDFDIRDPNYNRCESSSNKLLQLLKKGQRLLNSFCAIWREDYLVSLRERIQTKLKTSRIQSQYFPSV
ncbi:unnamed protein product [Mytilus coruscus]|uniref:Integrase zinc-binding domain-containing protein n=1 Tax=Mytilus coruscus TaxID=42192 RepID=A0A6J8E921_MYTCO|nr:unnamed protein product [Mytilus coruscus]